MKSNEYLPIRIIIDAFQEVLKVLLPCCKVVINPHLDCLKDICLRDDQDVAIKDRVNTFQIQLEHRFVEHDAIEMDREDESQRDLALVFVGRLENQSPRFVQYMVPITISSNNVEDPKVHEKSSFLDCLGILFSQIFLQMIVQLPQDRPHLEVIGGNEQSLQRVYFGL